MSLNFDIRRLSGVLLIIVSAVSFGTLAVLAPIAYRAGTDPISLLFLRFAIAAAIRPGLEALLAGARVDPDSRLIEHIEHAAQPAADLARQANAL